MKTALASSEAGGLEGLERVIEEMDNLRLIENVKERTSDCYYQTTQEVAGYIREINRETKDQLRILKQDPLQFNYESFFSRVSLLENVPWLRRVCEDACSKTMKETEKALRGYTTQLKEQMKKLVLKKENLQEAYNVLKQLAAIQCAEPPSGTSESSQSLISDIFRVSDEAYKESIEDFRDKTQQIFSRIRERLSQHSTEESKEGKRGFNAFLYLELQNNYEFLAECSKIEYITEGIGHIVQELTDFLMDSQQMIRTEMKTTFSSIRSSTEEQQLPLYIVEFVNRFQSLYEMRKTAPKLFELVRGETMINDWITRLMEYKDELTDEMDLCVKRKRSEDLKRNLKISNGFSSLDKFHDALQFRELTRNYTKSYYEGYEDVVKQIMDLVVNWKFNEAKLLLPSLNDDALATSMKETINMELLSAFSEIKNAIRQSSISYQTKKLTNQVA